MPDTEAGAAPPSVVPQPATEEAAVDGGRDEAPLDAGEALGGVGDAPAPPNHASMASMLPSMPDTEASAAPPFVLPQSATEEVAADGRRDEAPLDAGEALDASESART